MVVVVVGGAGYIGSHVCKALKHQGYTPVVFDNLENGHAWAVKWGPLVQGDLADTEAIKAVLLQFQPLGVIHLASYINARESNAFPEKYYRNNVEGSRHLLDAMGECRVDKIVFSSTAAVYGNPEEVPLSEDHPCQPINAYGETKWAVEKLLATYDNLSWVALRYFNAAGADPAGEIGEAHTPETHLIPLAILAALGKKPPIQIFGQDHPTPDGTPIRDYVHVTDLATAHVRALEWLLRGGKQNVFNLGCGRGYSVNDVVQTVERLLERPVPSHIGPRDPSDPPQLVADITKAETVLNWRPEFSDLETIVTTALQWHQR